LQHEVIRKNAEGKNGFTQADEGFRASGRAHVFRASKTTEAQVLGKQLLRSGTSIGANYREAFRARSKAEFIAKCGDSLREIEEWSVLGDRDIDGKTREVAGELLGKQRVKAPTGWNCSWNPESLARKNSLRCAKNGASGKQCDIDGQPERASVWENASQCEELTAIFVTILKRAKMS
jgi:hypothetical protein